jgi:hypothetical protein
MLGCFVFPRSANCVCDRPAFSRGPFNCRARRYLLNCSPNRLRTSDPSKGAARVAKRHRNAQLAPESADCRAKTSARYRNSSATSAFPTARAPPGQPSEAG